jgi:hypothetical protein
MCGSMNWTKAGKSSSLALWQLVVRCRLHFVPAAAAAAAMPLQRAMADCPALLLLSVTDLSRLVSGVTHAFWNGKAGLLQTCLRDQCLVFYCPAAVPSSCAL